MTQKIFKISGGESVIVDKDDLKIVSRYKWHPLRGKHTTYAQAKINGKMKLMHRVILSPDSSQLIDHINHNGLDNRRSNLRKVTSSQNNMNARISKNNKSGIKGVHWKTSHKSWRAVIDYNGKQIGLGYFKDINKAKEAREIAVRKYHKEYGHISN
jgi:hypothetical protein